MVSDKFHKMSHKLLGMNKFSFSDHSRLLAHPKLRPVVNDFIAELTIFMAAVILNNFPHLYDLSFDHPSIIINARGYPHTHLSKV